jgi:hypothetical protein
MIAMVETARSLVQVKDFGRLAWCAFVTAYGEFGCHPLVILRSTSHGAVTLSCRRDVLPVPNQHE